MARDTDRRRTNVGSGSADWSRGQRERPGCGFAYRSSRPSGWWHEAGAFAISVNRLSNAA